MTPLAWELLEDLHDPRGFNLRTCPFTETNQFSQVTPETHRKTCILLRRFLHEAKFFELTAVYPLMGTLASDMFDNYEDHDRVDQRRAFLPAPMSWIEFEQPGLKELKDMLDDENRRHELINCRFALDEEDLKHISYYYRTAWVFIGQRGDSTHVADRFHIGYETPRPEGTPRIWNVQLAAEPLPLVHSGLKPRRRYVHYNGSGEMRRFDKPVASITDFWHYAMLALINSPRIIGQRSHFPHGRIERQKLKDAKLVGKFPLRAWTEILLLVTPNPDNHSGDTPKEKHLTGERCLHYCRTYLRVRLGMLEYIEGHWRGNPALGMKRSRYRLKPESSKDTSARRN